MNNRKQIFVSVPEFDIIIIEDFDKRMKQRNAAKTLRRDYKLYHRGDLQQCDLPSKILSNFT